MKILNHNINKTVHDFVDESAHKLFVDRFRLGFARKEEGKDGLALDHLPFLMIFAGTTAVWCSLIED